MTGIDEDFAGCRRNSMDQHRFNQALTEFLASSPTPFHAVAQMAARLADTGFERLDESEAWQLVPGRSLLDYP